jgi:hypothetical protein
MGIGHHIVFDKDIMNDGAGYNVYTGIFTAPVTGLYLFTFSVDDNDRISALQLVKDGANLVDIVDSPANNKEVNVCFFVNKSSLCKYYCTFKGVIDMQGPFNKQ